MLKRTVVIVAQVNDAVTAINLAPFQRVVLVERLPNVLKDARVELVARAGGATPDLRRTWIVGTFPRRTARTVVLQSFGVGQRGAGRRASCARSGWSELAFGWRRLSRGCVRLRSSEEPNY